MSFKNLYHKINQKIFSCIFCVSGHKIERMNTICEDFCLAYEKKTNNYCSITLRPKYSNEIKRPSLDVDTRQGELAIVIQGPIYEQDNFTIETVKFYKIIFPKAIIIISTWENANSQTISNLKELGCQIVLSKNIDNYGMCNVNYQLCTSRAGVIKAQELGATYTMKTRTDQRVYKKYAFEYLKSLLELFPMESNLDNKPLGKIVTINGVKGQLFSPYWIQDFFYFGFTDDIMLLFSAKYDERNYHSYDEYKYKNNIKECSIYQNSLLEVPEVYITKRYLERFENLDDSVKQSWELISKYFIGITNHDIDLFWIKYSRRFNEYIINNTYHGHRDNSDAELSLTFQNYLNILSRRYNYETWYEELGKSLIH